MEKREPLLADKFVANVSKQVVVHPVTLERIRNRVRSAKRFVLDPEGLVRAAEVMRDIPDLLIREQQFARAPYDLTWIEIGNFRLWWKTLTGREPDDTADEAIGYLIDHGNVYVVSGGQDRHAYDVALLPLYYKLHQPWGIEQQSEFARLARLSLMEIDGFLWGESVYKLIRDYQSVDNNIIRAHKHGGDLNDEFARFRNVKSLREHHGCDVLPLNKEIDKAKIVRVIVDGSAGDLRNIIGLLLLMNRPSLTRYVREFGHQRGFIKGKLRPFMSHTVVSIPVDPQPVLRKIGTAEGEGVPRRRHEVRGHYCHDYDAREYAKIGCIHEWQVDPHPDDDPSEPDHWLCKVCSGKRWWRHAHERGTAQIGYVNKDYEIVQ